MTAIQIGLANFLTKSTNTILGKRLGLLCNPASIGERFTHTRELIHQKFPGQLKALFSPQHGFFAEKQDNMIESGDIIDPVLNIPVFSLYGKTRVPAIDMFDLIDVLVVDLQDAGTRVYTFIYTLSYCMETAAKTKKKIIVLDRPNPVNGIQVEGNCLSEEYASFVGRYPIPMRHGLTIGELALLFNSHFKISCDLEVIPMNQWRREMYYQDTGLPWIAPSPNLPTPTSTMVYPGQVIWEGTNISEGRGTTQPFEIFGAPFLDTDKILKTIGGSDQQGAFLRPLVFEPTSNKWTGTPCHGFQIHVIDPNLYEPYKTSLKVLSAILYNHKDKFQWKPPPYEYEFKRLPMDLILGSRHIRKQIEKLENIDKIEASWQKELEEFKTISKRYHLYK